MNALGIVLFWCVTQVTLLAIVAGAMYCVARRFGPAVGAYVSFIALLLMTAVTAFSFSSWPNWVPALEARMIGTTMNQSSPARFDEVETEDSALAADLLSPQSAADAASESPWRAAAAAFWGELRRSRDEDSERSEGWNWASLIALVVLSAVVLGWLRLTIGLWSVRRYRRLSQPILDTSLLELTDILAAQLGCTRSVRLRECKLLSGAATVGWRNPLILLPLAWRDWEPGDRRAVLAHELAHIHHHDYLTWLAAQFGLMLHFYHPLAHWLCRCLRLDQELVADSVAARLAGGRQTYLQSLAHIALQQADLPVSWPARTFLPTRRTFLRRIEMLRDSKQWLASSPRSLRWATAVVLMATGFAVLGLRAPVGTMSGAALAQQPKPKTDIPAQAKNADSAAFSLAYVPRDTFLIFATRPSSLLQRPALQSVAKIIGNMDDVEKDLGVRPQQVVTLHVLVLPIGDRQMNGEPMAIIVRVADADSSKRMIEHIAPGATKEEYGAQEYFRRPPRDFYFRPDERTVVYAKDEGVIRRCLVAGQMGAATTKWAPAWAEVANNDAAALINTTVLRQLIAKELQAAGFPAAPTPAEAFRMQLAPFTPLWEKADLAVAGLRVSNTLSVKVTAKSANADDAKRVHDTLKATVTMAQNMLSQARQSASASRSPEGALLLGAVDIADTLLDNVKIEQKDVVVTAAIDAGADQTVQLATILTPAVLAAREAARRTQARNNLKQLGLAFHHYHDAHRHFPPAVVYGPNKVPRSWRIELLPYLNGATLYEQYRKDEPWDSDHNKKILAQMPAVFRSPQDNPASTNTSYFVLTGPDTVFDTDEGTYLANIVDGTSNVILALEAKRNVPWTKPDDIAYAADKPVPKLGGWQKGGYSVLLCDGSVRFISENIDERIMRLLITKGDGHPIPDFDR